jgi:Fe-S cluster assembly protein SufD
MSTHAINTELKDILSKQLRENISSIEWLSIKQIKALDYFEQSGFPSTKVEDWKYTSMNNALKKSYTFGDKNNNSILPTIPTQLDGNIVCMLDGIYQESMSKWKDSTEVFNIEVFDSATGEEFKKYFSSVQSLKDSYSDLNLASAQNTLIITLKKGKSLQHPIYLYLTNSVANDVFFQPRILLIAEENSKGTLVEIHHKQGDVNTFSNCYTEVYLKRDASVNYYKIQPKTDHHFHVGTTQVVHLEKSYFEAATISLGSDMVRNNMNIVLKDSYSESTLNGLYIAHKNQHIDNHTLVDHAVPNCLSNELYKGVLSGESTGVFNGKIFVRQDAQKTNAFQSNKNILLSKNATMNTKPQLEIFADDVKCSHGATIGQLDEEPLFYLRSRGLSEESAKALLVSAFTQDITTHIKPAGLQEWIAELIEETMSQLKS